MVCLLVTQKPRPEGSEAQATERRAYWTRYEGAISSLGTHGDLLWPDGAASSIQVSRFVSHGDSGPFQLVWFGHFPREASGARKPLMILVLAEDGDGQWLDVDSSSQSLVSGDGGTAPRRLIY